MMRLRGRIQVEDELDLLRTYIEVISLKVSKPYRMTERELTIYCKCVQIMNEGDSLESDESKEKLRLLVNKDVEDYSRVNTYLLSLRRKGWLTKVGRTHSILNGLMFKNGIPKDGIKLDLNIELT